MKFTVWIILALDRDIHSKQNDSKYLKIKSYEIKLLLY